MSTIDSASVFELMPVVPLHNLVVFPGVVMSLELGGSAGARLAQEIAAGRAPRVLLAPRKGDDQDLVGAIGVEAETQSLGKRRGTQLVTVRALERRRVMRMVQREPFLTAETAPVGDILDPAVDAAELVRTVKTQAARLLREEEAAPSIIALIETSDDPAALVDRIAVHAGLGASVQLEIFSELDVARRLALLAAGLERRLAALAVAKANIDPHLREKVLRERLVELKKELGEAPDAVDDGGFAERITAAGMPPEAEQAARRALRRLGGLDKQSPEYSVAQTYLEWLVELPWSKRSADQLDLVAARRVLDEDHQGLAKVKQRIVEYLAVRKLNPNKKAPILLLVGPPGVGKTSLGRSIARTLGRELVRASLGGVRDEAEIRGHRRTYIGAQPGRIVQALRRAGTKNPVFVLDEIDKLGDGHGDPAAALLEVLDPEQNGSFSDHYLEVPFDLSEVVFIATANDLAPIAAPLRDRMEILTIPGYTTAEKREIARGHLVPRQLIEHGLGAAQLSFDTAALEAIIEGHTREAGVRNLERELAKVVRGVAVQVAGGATAEVHIGVDQLVDYLGPTAFFAEAAETELRPGVATGLAWTPTGGEILFIEAALMPGSGGLLVTGQLGDVMRESAQAALSFVRSHAEELGIAADRFSRTDVHLHVPDGATPKDGPSAGNAIATALVSLFTGRRVRGDVAMTGEITLRGHILPVGGIAAKVLAAHRAGIRRVILPARNAKDLAEIPAEVRAAVELALVSRLAESLELALEPAVLELEHAPANGNVPRLERPQIAA